jgi:flagellin-like hook-associated protein FlgL
MINGLDAQANHFLFDLKKIQDRQDKVQRALGSGIRVNRASDGPERVVDILNLRSEIQRSTAIGVNLDRGTAEVDSAEAAVRVMVQLVERARVLAAQTATHTAQNRQVVAVEAKQLHEQLVSLTGTISEGRYVFSGDLDQKQLYAVDWTQPGGIVRLDQANNTRVLEDGNGSRFSVSQSAHQILDTRNTDDTFAADNAFNAVHALGVALENDDVAGVNAAAVLLETAVDRLGQATTFYGHVQNRVRDAISLNENAVIARKKELGQAQDTNVAEALVELNLSKVHQDAALGAQARRPSTSLFDFLA